MQKKRLLKEEAGFTLIEIIAVLVILGILAAVAVPKYIDMQATAKTKATEGALAAAAGNVQMVYANAILANNGTAPTMAALETALSVATYTAVGDFTVTYAASGTTGILITVTAPAGKFDSTNATKTVVLQ